MHVRVWYRTVCGYVSVRVYSKRKEHGKEREKVGREMLVGCAVERDRKTES